MGNDGRQVKSRERVRERGEVFTAEREVKAMCDLVKNETERIDSTFLEPACGDGNFLIEILTRKLAVVVARYGKSADDLAFYSIRALMSLYGVDILKDNVEACRERLFGVWVAIFAAKNAKSAKVVGRSPCDRHGHARRVPLPVRPDRKKARTSIRGRFRQGRCRTPRAR